jgi:hypothetical protein
VNFETKRLNSIAAHCCADATEITIVTSDDVYFTTRIADEAHGLFGLITEGENQKPADWGRTLSCPLPMGVVPARTCARHSA